MRHRAVFIAGMALLAVLAARRCERTPPRAPLRLATFNIESFPKHSRQVRGAFAAIAELAAPIVAVQEIRDARLFARIARKELGDWWLFEHLDGALTGVLYDGRVFELVSRAVHEDTLVDGRYKATLEARLAPKDGGPVVQVFVVHLMWGAAGRPVRQKQYRALGGLLVRERRPGERTLLMGDFNATEDADREDLARLAAIARLVWASEPLACSAFWDREDACATSRLDHVLMSERPTAVVARGGCADGCEVRDRCPRWFDEVSDHCPVVVSLP